LSFSSGFFGRISLGGAEELAFDTVFGLAGNGGLLVSLVFGVG
jgi:hypothetical protein